MREEREPEVRMHGLREEHWQTQGRYLGAIVLLQGPMPTTPFPASLSTTLSVQQSPGVNHKHRLCLRDSAHKKEFFFFIGYVFI